MQSSKKPSKHVRNVEFLFSKMLPPMSTIRPRPPTAANYQGALYLPQQYSNFLNREREAYMSEPVHPMFATNSNNENYLPTPKPVAVPKPRQIVVPMETKSTGFAGATTSAKGTATFTAKGGRRAVHRRKTRRAMRSSKRRLQQRN